MPTDNFFTPLNDEDKRTNILSTISSPVWSGGTATLTAFYTSSIQSGSSGDYYYDVYDKVQTDTTRQVQFAVSYGHIDGSGSLSTTAGNNFKIGALDGSWFTSGNIDEVAIWDIALTAGDITEIYNATDFVTDKGADLSSMSTPPIAWYRLGD